VRVINPNQSAIIKNSCILTVNFNELSNQIKNTRQRKLQIDKISFSQKFEALLGAHE